MEGSSKGEADRIWELICTMMEEQNKKEGLVERCCSQNKCEKGKILSQTLVGKDGEIGKGGKRGTNKKKRSEVERLISDIEEDLEFSGKGDRRKGLK